MERPQQNLLPYSGSELKMSDYYIKRNEAWLNSFKNFKPLPVNITSEELSKYQSTGDKCILNRAMQRQKRKVILYSTKGVEK